MTVEFRVT